MNCGVHSQFQNKIVLRQVSDCVSPWINGVTLPTDLFGAFIFPPRETSPAGEQRGETDVFSGYREEKYDVTSPWWHYFWMTTKPTTTVTEGERQKSKRFLLIKQQICTCITLFCTFLCRRCTHATWNFPISRVFFSLLVAVRGKFIVNNIRNVRRKLSVLFPTRQTSKRIW